MRPSTTKAAGERPPRGKHQGLVRMLILAVSYALVEEITLRLAAAPLYAVAIWPAAGLALGAMLVWGRGCWPGLFIGAYLGDVLHGTTGMGSDAILGHALVSILNSAGTIGQAALGATLTRHLLRGRSSLSLYRDVTRFLLLGGPVSCLIGATAGIIARHLDGRLPSGTAVNFWLNWWAGDCIGVVLFAPVVLMALSESRRVWRERVLQVAVPLLGTAIVVVIGGVWVNRTQDEDAGEWLDREAGVVKERITLDLAERMEALRLLGAFFNASENVTGGEFKAFTRVDARKPGIQAQLWAPLVLQQARAEFETSLAAAEGKPTPVTEISFDGSYLTDRLRSDYVPLRYVEPAQGIPAPAGFNLASDHATSETMAKACDAALPCAVPAPFEVNGRRPLLICSPVFTNGFDPLQAAKPQRRENLQGFVVSVLKLDQIFGSFLRNVEAQGLSFRVREDGLRGPQASLVESASPPEGGDPRQTRVVPFDIGGRRWAVELAPMRPLWLPGQIERKELFLAGSVLLSLLTAIFVLAAAGQGSAIAHEVGERTAELETEVANRRAVESELRTSESRSRELNSILENLVRERSSELAASMDVFQSVADLSPAGIFRTNASGELTYANERLRQICGLGEDAALSDWESLVHPEDLPEMNAQWRKAHRDRVPFHSLLRISRPGRVLTWITVQTVPALSADGLPGGMVGTVIDVTNQRQTELALRILSTELAGLSGEEFFTAMVSKLADLLCVDLAVVSQLQAGPAPALATIAMVMDGKALRPQTFPLKDAPCARTPSPGCTPEVRQKCRLYPNETLHALGSSRACAGVALADTQGRMLGHLAVRCRRPFDDPSRIDSILRLFAVSAGAELERMRREKQFSDLFECAPDATLLVGPEGTVRLANRQAARLFGGAHEGLPGRKFSELVSEGPRSQQVALQADGTRVPVEINTGTIESSGGPLLAVSIRDLTERTETEKRLRQIQRMESLGTLAGGIAHDLNNTLAPILMGTELLRMDFSADGLHFLDVIETNARRGADMVRQLLAFARGSEGERVLLDMRKILREIELIVRSTFPKGIRLETRYADHLVPVLGDHTQMHQVLLNLCVNARDAMPGGGWLRIEAESCEKETAPTGFGAVVEPGMFFVLRVRDTGSGIPPEAMDRIFDPFFTTKGAEGGTGLGLSTVLGIVKSHGGVLQVHSAPGQGTTFEVYLPMGAEAPPSFQDEPRVDFYGDGETVLVVDDEASIRFMLKPALEMMRFEVVTAGNGSEALARFRELSGRVGLVLIDINMPVMDGVALARELRGSDPNIPILAMTGLQDEARMVQLKQLGVHHTLAKPFGLADLVAAIKSLREDGADGDLDLLLSGEDRTSD